MLKSSVLSLTAMLFCASHAWAQNSASYAGTYKRTKPALSDMTISQSGQEWLLKLSGAGAPDGAATAGDCEIQAKGSIENNVLTAKIIPFTGALSSVTQANIDANKYGTNVFKVKFSHNHATVTEQDVSFCGMGADLGGTYKKQGR